MSCLCPILCEFVVDVGTYLGFWQGGSVTNAMFYEMLPHFLFFHPSGEGEDEDEEMDSSVASRRDSGIVEWCVFGVNKYDGATEDLLPEDGDIVAPGLYVVLGPGESGLSCNMKMGGY